MIYNWQIVICQFNTFSTSLDARSAHFQMIRVMIHFVITFVSVAGYIPARGSRRFSL